MGLGVYALADSDSPLNLVFSHQFCCSPWSPVDGYPVGSIRFGTYAAWDSDVPSNFVFGRCTTATLAFDSGRSTGFGVNCDFASLSPANFDFSHQRSLSGPSSPTGMGT